MAPRHIAAAAPDDRPVRGEGEAHRGTPILLCRPDVLLLLLVLSAGAFNLDVRHAKVIADPSGLNGSYFGFTVALLKERNAVWAVVGAPRGVQCGSQGRASGVVYKCRTDDGGDEPACTPIALPEGRETNCRSACGCENGRGERIGWTVDVQDAEDGGILVCDPGWRDLCSSNSKCVPNGACFWLSGTGSKPRKLTPIERVSEYENHKEEMDYYGYEAAGFSAHFVRDSDEIIFGAPGAFNQHGTVIRYHDPVNNMDTPSAYLNRNTTNVAYSDMLFPDSNFTEEPKYEPLFGFSVSSGRFFRSNKTSYVSSAPRSSSLRGKVFIFNFPVTDKAPLLITHEFEGSQMGEYFGYSLCVVDLNSDGLDDLIVGAPYHTLDNHNSVINEESGDEGRIYVFVNQDEGRMVDSGHQIMGNKQSGARFGTSMTRIGDLNADGFPDIAVGAPYEDIGRGAVYIYHGSIDGVNSHYAQRISALEIDHSLLGFGMSISRGLDIDGNHYNDIAVGAYMSGHVVLLKAQPIIRFHTRLITNMGKMDVNVDGFLRVCINYTGIHVPHSLVAAVTLTVKRNTDEMHLVVNSIRNLTYSYFPKLMRNNNQCEIFGLEITSPKGSSRPNEVEMEFKIAFEGEGPEKPSHNYLKQREGDIRGNHLCPIVDPMLPNSIMYKIPLPTYCGEEHICITDIESKVAISGVTWPFVIGSAKYMEMSVLIKNNRGPANLVQTTIVFPRVTPLKSIPHICQEFPEPDKILNNSLLVCEIGNPMASQEMKLLPLVFDVQNIPTGYSGLTFKISSTSAGEELKPENNDKEIMLPLRTVSDVSISGKSFQEQVYSFKNKCKLQNTISFSHIFEVYTFGPSPLNLARFIFKVPTAVETSSGIVNFNKVYHPQTYAGYPSILCSSDVDFDDDAGILPMKDASKIKCNKELKKSEKSWFQKMIGMNPSKTRKKRIRRDLDDEEEEEDEEDDGYMQGRVPKKRAFVADCSLPQFKCMVLYCFVGPIQSNRTRAVITVPMELFPVAVDNLLKEKDIMILHSSGAVTTEDISHSIQPDIHEPDRVYVSTIFFGKFQEFKVDIWILLISISGGIMTLFPIILLLFKTGFFNRRKRRDLEFLKENLLQIREEVVEAFELL